MIGDLEIRTQGRLGGPLGSLLCLLDSHGTHLELGNSPRPDRGPGSSAGSPTSPPPVIGDENCIGPDRFDDPAAQRQRTPAAADRNPVSGPRPDRRRQPGIQFHQRFGGTAAPAGRSAAFASRSGTARRPGRSSCVEAGLSVVMVKLAALIKARRAGMVEFGTELDRRRHATIGFDR